MSDITKKIFSIEQTENVPDKAESPKSNWLRPIADEPIIDKKATKAETGPETVPEFVTRDAVQPLMSPPSNSIEMVKPPKAAGWLILGFGLMYIVGAGLYFGWPLLNQSVGLLPIAGIAVLLILPLILLFLLWHALKHLSVVTFQNAKLTEAANILVSPDIEALNRTENLSMGIRNEISKVNSDLSKTVEAFKEVQLSITRHATALDTAGMTLTSRSDDVGRTLTLQRQALEGLSGTFDTRMSTLSTQISDTSQTLDGICTAAESKLLSAGEALQKATALVDETVISSTSRLEEKIATLETAGENLSGSTEALTSSISASADNLLQSDAAFTENTTALKTLNTQTQTQISELQATIGHGYEVIAELREAADSRKAALETHYAGLTEQIKQSEDNTLVAQGKTARMVESNLAQMRRDFSRMETDLKSLQAKLNNARAASQNMPEVEEKPARLNLQPLETDFPPVQPTESVVESEFEPISESPMNLGADMEIEDLDQPLINFEPDLIQRPAEVEAKPKTKGFGRRKDKDEKSGWRWRDMLGTLDRPEGSAQAATLAAANPLANHGVNAVALLTGLKLSPSAIVDEGTVIEATQARVNKGELGLTSVVTEKLPEAVTHLKESLNRDENLKADLLSFTSEFATKLSQTPPTAPALRAALGSPNGRAYLLCAAALRTELRG